MAHDRKLVIGGVALTKARLRNDVAAMSAVRDELERILIESDFFIGAPFTWISLVLRLGLENKPRPELGRINKTHGDLPVSIELDVQPLVGADLEVMKAAFRRAAIEALLHVAGKYGLPEKPLEE